MRHAVTPGDAAPEPSRSVPGIVCGGATDNAGAGLALQALVSLAEGPAAAVRQARVVEWVERTLMPAISAQARPLLRLPGQLLELLRNYRRPC